uniref:Choline transporter-like protein n=1 Tax=Haptolina ericina TaxID=156174 RepID=A0A7S3BD99_9EUKA
MAVQLGFPVGLVTNITSALHVGAVSQTQEQFFLGCYAAVGFVWTYYTLSAILLITISANVFYFYFVDKDTVAAEAYDNQYDDNQTNWPVLVHLGYTLRFHVGTAAFGALILTIVTAFQVATKALFDSMKRAQGGGTQMLKVIEVCVQYCLWCFKKSIEFINSYAYVYVFMENVGFCTACYKTFVMIKDNSVQIAINKIVQMVISLMQSCTTPLVCAFASYYSFNFMQTEGQEASSFSILTVTGFVFVTSFLMTKAFVQVYSQVVQSLTVCVLHDVNEYDGRYTREQLRKAFELPKPTGSNKDLV